MTLVVHSIYSDYYDCVQKTAIYSCLVHLCVWYWYVQFLIKLLKCCIKPLELVLFISVIVFLYILFFNKIQLFCYGNQLKVNNFYDLDWIWSNFLILNRLVDFKHVFDNRQTHLIDYVDCWDPYKNKKDIPY